MKDTTRLDSSIIRLQHKYAQKFFEEATRPDIEALKRRDAFLLKSQQKYPIRTDGMDLIIEIPDIDISKMMKG